MIVNGRAVAAGRFGPRIRALVKSPLLVHPLSIYGRVLSIDCRTRESHAYIAYVRHATFSNIPTSLFLALRPDFTSCSTNLQPFPQPRRREKKKKKKERKKEKKRRRIFYNRYLPKWRVTIRDETKKKEINKKRKEKRKKTLSTGGIVFPELLIYRFRCPVLYLD